MASSKVKYTQMLQIPVRNSIPTKKNAGCVVCVKTEIGLPFYHYKFDHEQPVQSYKVVIVNSHDAICYMKSLWVQLLQI